MTTQAPAFRRGGESLQDATKGGGAFSKTYFFSLEDGEDCLLRFITDASEWITVDQHAMVPTKAKPADYPADAKWPERFSAVCRRDKAFQGDPSQGIPPIHEDCYICDHIVDGKQVRKASGRGWALACYREEVIENGQKVGVRDKTRTVTRKKKDASGNYTEETEEVTEKAVVVVNMGWKNFFSTLQGSFGRYGTILDRDYYIKRSGSDQTTTYTILPEDPILLEGGEKYDLRNPDILKRYDIGLDLAEIVAEAASDERYARFFDPRYTVAKDDKVEATGVTEIPKQENDVDPDRLTALANRVKGYGDAPATETAADAPPQQEEPAPAVATSGGLKNFD